jgi:hypothetical protein
MCHGRQAWRRSQLEHARGVLRAILSAHWETAEAGQAGHELVLHGPPGDQCRSKLSPLARARAIGSKNPKVVARHAEAICGLTMCS